MKILISVSAKAPKTTGEYLTELNKVVKTYFKKAKQFDSHYKDILKDCDTLAKRFAGERFGDSRSTQEIFESLLNKQSGELRFSGADDKSHYDEINPQLLKIGNQAFKKMLEIVTKEDVNAANADKWYIAYALASTCTRIFSKNDPLRDVQDLKRFKLFTYALAEVDIDLTDLGVKVFR